MAIIFNIYPLFASCTSYTPGKRSDKDLIGYKAEYVYAFVAALFDDAIKDGVSPGQALDDVELVFLGPVFRDLVNEAADYFQDSGIRGWEIQHMNRKPVRMERWESLLRRWGSGGGAAVESD